MSLRDDFFAVMDAFAEGVLVYDDQNELVGWNQAALEMLGLTPDNVKQTVNRPPNWALLNADLSPLAHTDVPSAIARRTRQPVLRKRMAVRLGHGKFRELLVSAVPLFRDDGEVDFVMAALLDVTRELAVVNELRVFEQFFDLSADLLVVTDEKASVVHVNDAVVTTLGGPRERFLGQAFIRDVVHAEDVERIMKLGPSAPSPWEFTTRLKTSSGALRNVAWRVVAGHATHEGRTYFARGVDVTERLAEQAELARSRELVHDAFELTQLAVMERDLTSNRITLTSRLKELLELRDGPDEALEKFVMPEDLELFRAHLATQPTEHGERRALSLRLRTATGAIRNVRVWHRPVRDERGAIIRELTVVQDVTQQSLEQARQRLTERLNSLGTMAAGVAHEINNPLSFILANLNVVSEALTHFDPTPGVDMEDLKSAVLEAIEGAERVRQIVLSMRPFARSDEKQRASCDVVRIMQASLNLARNELRHRARVVTDFKPVPGVWANEARLGQVFLNLLLNAAQAIPDGRAADNEVRVTTHAERGQVVITVRDSGRGISSEVLPRIFDPFFSTKAVGGGSGLGLFISQSIVQEYGGQLIAESTEGAGATFEVRLPSREAQAQTTPTVPAARGMRVLIVDDEPSILRSIERLIGRSHQLTLAQSGREALSHVQRMPDFDLVICDMMMPELSGIDVWNALTPEQRERFVFMTGGTFTEGAEAFIAANQPHVLPKPFTATSLDELLARAQTR
ncbi:MAG: ATP-binding protein [Archangium sp.]